MVPCDIIQGAIGGRKIQGHGDLKEGHGIYLEEPHLVLLYVPSFHGGEEHIPQLFLPKSTNIMAWCVHPV